MRTTKPVALVTGGAKGIGRAIAHQLVSTGWQVGIIDLPDSGVRRAYARERSIFVIDGDVTRSTGSFIASTASMASSPMPAS
jgi:NAD(P)-dependent dehydrogenase (short-subunit alcohol dehydrogenase family)